LSRKRERKPYSVLLRYPPDRSDGPETFYGFARARNLAHAVGLVRRQAARHLVKDDPFNTWDAEDLRDLGLEFEVELVLRGHHRDLAWD